METTSKQNSGSVLVLTLWVLFLLSAIAVAVGSFVQSSLKIAATEKRRTTCYALARAATDQACMEILSDTNGWDSLDEPWANSVSLFREVKLEGGVFSVEPSATDGTRPGLSDEESRINITLAPVAQLQALFETIGGVDTRAALELAGAVKDWCDLDDDVELTGGAESSYYHALDRPLQCHNGPMKTVYELIVIKGVTPALFERLQPYITVYGTGKVNLNTADAVVLETVARGAGGVGVVPQNLAEKLFSARGHGAVYKTSDVGAIMAEVGRHVALEKTEADLLQSMMGSLHVRSTCFRGVAVGQVRQEAERHGTEGSGYERRMEFGVNRLTKTKLYWHED